MPRKPPESLSATRSTAVEDTVSVASPCINVCTIDEDSALCLGCARNLQEVARWSRMTVAQKQEVLAALPERKRQMQAAGADCRWREE